MDQDPVAQSHHGSQHCLYFDPSFPVKDIRNTCDLQSRCDMINHCMTEDPRHMYARESRNYWEAMRIVRINQFIHSLRDIGNIKPMLIMFDGEKYEALTGGTRLMALERTPDITQVAVFITTHSRYRNVFSHLMPVENFSQFAAHFNAPDHTQYYFRLTDDQAPYGLDWYEISLQATGQKLFDDRYCLTAVQNYINSVPEDFQFSPEWFDQKIDWDYYYNLSPDVLDQ